MGCLVLRSGPSSFFMPLMTRLILRPLVGSGKPARSNMHLMAAFLVLTVLARLRRTMRHSIRNSRMQSSERMGSLG